MHTTPMYEAAPRHADTGEVAVVSVKSGHSNPVEIPELVEAAGSATAFAYSTHGLYSAPPSEKGVVQLQHDELVSFRGASRAFSTACLAMAPSQAIGWPTTTIALG